MGATLLLHLATGHILGPHSLKTVDMFVPRMNKSRLGVMRRRRERKSKGNCNGVLLWSGSFRVLPTFPNSFSYPVLSTTLGGRIAIPFFRTRQKFSLPSIWAIRFP
jgi:hypothetical protein